MHFFMSTCTSLCLFVRSSVYLYNSLKVFENSLKILDACGSSGCTLLFYYISFSVYLYVSLSTGTFLCLHKCLSVYIPIFLYIFPSIRLLAVCRYVSLSVCTSLCLPVLPSVYLYIALSAGTFFCYLY